MIFGKPVKFALIVVVTVFYALRPANGSDSTLIKEWVSKSLLPPDLPLTEIERYLEARIPRMPAVTSREEWEKEATRIREQMLAKIVYAGKGAAWRDAALRVEWGEVLHGDESYRIKKLRYEALPGLWIPALLYEPLNLRAPAAVAMNVNGHDGNGKAAVYKQIRSINQAKRGMLSLNVEWLGMGQLRSQGYSHSRMNQLDLCGTSGMAPFYLAMKRGLDVLLSHPHADAKRVAVSGLSGGGWQTIFISSLDTRVTYANPVAGYSSFLTRIHNHSDLGDSEQTPNDMATVADYSHLTALLAPRTTLLTYNVKDDCCFASGHALPPLLEAAKPVFKLYGQESRLRSHVNHDPGTHNFERDNREAHYRMLVEFVLSDQTGISPIEIDSQSEVKTAEQLNVELPQPNADFNSLAKQLMEKLPLDSELPGEGAKLPAWQDSKRQTLKEVLRVHDYLVAEEKVEETKDGGNHVVSMRLRVGESWTLPVIEISPEKATSTALLVMEGGHTSSAETIEQLVKSGRRVVVMDPFYIGESHIKNRAYLWGLLLQAVGDRPAGIQASQIAAVARWIKKRHGASSVEIRAHGERLGLSALCAAALEPQIDSVHLTGSIATLRQVIERNEGFDAKPELFCFGLLEKFDVKSISALCVPREVRFAAASNRHSSELAGLSKLYEVAGKKFDPLAE